MRACVRTYVRWGWRCLWPLVLFGFGLGAFPAPLQSQADLPQLIRSHALWEAVNVASQVGMQVSNPPGLPQRLDTLAVPSCLECPLPGGRTCPSRHCAPPALGVARVTLLLTLLPSVTPQAVSMTRRRWIMKSRTATSPGPQRAPSAPKPSSAPCA